MMYNNLQSPDSMGHPFSPKTHDGHPVVSISGQSSNMEHCPVEAL